MQMSKTKYRWLVSISFSLPLLGMLYDLLIPGAIPLVLKEAMDTYFQEMNVLMLLLQLIFAAAFLVIGFFSIYGQLRFRPWGPKFALWTSVLACVLIPLSGPALFSGINFLAIMVGETLWGIVLVLPYLSPEIKAAFWPERA